MTWLRFPASGIDTTSSTWPVDWHDGKWLLPNILVLFVLYAVGTLAFQLANVNDVTPVWPLSGIALAVLLISQFRVLPGVLIGYWLLDSSLYQNLLLGIVMGTGETFSALIAALLILKWSNHFNIFSTVRHTFLFAIAAGIASFFNATLGTSLLYLNGSASMAEYFDVWRTWWTADTVGFLVFAPLLLTWQRGFKPAVKAAFGTLQKFGELILLIGLVSFISWEAFGVGYKLEYMFLLPMVWAAFRFGQQISTLLVVILSSISILATAQGVGIFAMEMSPDSLVLLQSFVGVLSLTILILLSTISEQKSAEQQLKHANEFLESRVQERTAELSQALIDLKNMQIQLVQTEKMSALGQMVAGVAHEINNPVNFIHANLTHAATYFQNLLDIVGIYRKATHDPEFYQRNNIELSELDFLEEDVQKLLQSMEIGTNRISEIVNSLRNFSRLDESELKTADIHEGLDNTLVILQHRLGMSSVECSSEIKVLKSYGDLPLVDCYPGQLNQVFMNVISNAIDAIQECDRQGSSQEIDAEPNMLHILTELNHSGNVAIRIRDNGTGIPGELHHKLFDPFFTTKPVGYGTGLGLSISHQIITEKHKGKLYFHSDSNQGTEFVIEIPVSQA